MTDGTVNGALAAATAAALVGTPGSSPAPIAGAVAHATTTAFPPASIFSGQIIDGVTASSIAAALSGTVSKVTYNQLAAIYGIVDYGEVLYGQKAIPAPPILLGAVPVQIRVVAGNSALWLAEPFVAQSLNYGSVGVSWNTPLGIPARWRLISNRYGYPVDQNDGNILIDQAEWPGNFYLDQNIIPGQYIYYGLYAQLDPVSDIWQRVAVTGCLANANSGKAAWLQSHLPGYFSKYLNGELTQDAVGNPYLYQFLQVLGWGLDYVQAQYDMAFKHLNDPMFIPVDDLVNLAAEIGMPYDPMISIYLMRKAAANWAHVAEERGTPLGIVNQIDLLTGFGVDYQTGPNLLLNDDQSYVANPIYAEWVEFTTYHLNECCHHGKYHHRCLIEGTRGIEPDIDGVGNANWHVIDDEDDPADTLRNPHTGGCSTWEVIFPAKTNGVIGQVCLHTGLGERDPDDDTRHDHRCHRIENHDADDDDMFCRSISRRLIDIEDVTITEPFIPDPAQAINDGVPVPFTRPSMVWDSTVRYGTGDIVTYSGQPFLALRASTGATPPFSSTATAEWAPLSTDARLRLMVSGATRGAAVPVTPFVEWYDIWGRMITKVTARTPVAGTPGIPDQLAFDGFLLNPASTISGRSFDNGYGHTWTAQANDFTIAPSFGGIAVPNSNARAEALTTVPADTDLAVTFVTLAGGSQEQGIVFRWSDDSNYWKATPTKLVKRVAGAFTTVANYPTDATTGDRLHVSMTGSSINVYLNGTEIVEATDSFNSTATKAGMIVE